MDFQKLSKNLFFVFLFILPFQTVYLLREPIISGEKWQYGTIGVYLSDVLIVSALVLGAYYWLKKHRLFGIMHLVSSIMHREKQKCIMHNTKYEIRFIDAVLPLLVLWALASTLWASDTALAAYSFAKLLLAMGAFLFARSLDKRERGAAVKVLLAVAMLQSALAIAQFLSQTALASTLLGMGAHDAWTAGTSVLKLESGRWLRAYGSFPHPNMLGGFLAVTFVLGISHFVARTGKQQSLFSFFILHFSLAILLLGLILTFSRAAWIGVMLGIGSIVLFQKSKIKNFTLVGILSLAILVFSLVLRDQVFPRFDAAAIRYERSVEDRTQSISDAKELILANPLIGVGAGNFTRAVMTDHPDRPLWSVQPAHNVFVLVFAELGAVGLLLFMGSMFSVFRPKVFNFKSAILLTILPSLFLDHFLWSSHFGILFFFLLAGFSSANRE